MLVGHTKGVDALEWTENGLLLSESEDGTTRVWNPSQSKQQVTLSSAMNTTEIQSVYR